MPYVRDKDCFPQRIKNIFYEDSNIRCGRFCVRIKLVDEVPLYLTQNDRVAHIIVSNLLMTGQTRRPIASLSESHDKGPKRMSNQALMVH